MRHKEIRLYQTREGKRPFLEWFRSLKDNAIKTKIRMRLDRVELGNLGDYKSLGDGVYELRFKMGIRIYFGQVGNIVVLLLHGGNKRTQVKDIKRAREYWSNYHA
jgi:putative addiction module killer protein